jgi:hypothetical protein
MWRAASAVTKRSSSTEMASVGAAACRKAERALAHLPDSHSVTEVTARLFAVFAVNSATHDEHRLADILALAQSELGALHRALGELYFAPAPAPAVQSQRQSA